MKRNLLLIYTLFCFCFLSAQHKVALQEPLEQSVNFGVKGGFNSSMYFVDEFRIVDVTIDEIQNNYKVGYFGAFFMRINLNKHFVQPEIHYTVSKSEIVFDKRGTQSSEIDPDYVAINSTIRSMEFPILYGYNFIKRPPYGMCFFAGPKPKYVWKKKSKLEFDNFDQTNITEELRPINLSIIAGVGVTISNIFFDFTYEFGMHNISRSITYDYEGPDGTEKVSNMVLNRRNNLLSFSLGVFF